MAFTSPTLKQNNLLFKNSKILKKSEMKNVYTHTLTHTLEGIFLLIPRECSLLVINFSAQFPLTGTI